MEAKLRMGDKAHLRRRCCVRVKCFVETDAGFSPTISKTDLAHEDAFTNALKNFGNKPSGKNSEIKTEIFKDGKLLALVRVEKEYQDWVSQMHEEYDEELNCGEDEPVLVLHPSNKRKLCITSDVVRVHKMVKRNGKLWKSGQKIKFLKGSVPGSKNNLYMTLEYILLEGFQGDAGGEARLICRPIDFPDKEGCSLSLIDEHATLDIHKSLSFPISTIDSQKCVAVDDARWHFQLEKKRQKGMPHLVKFHNAPEQLLPNTVIQELILEMLDVDGNHIRGVEVNIKADGLCFLDCATSSRKVDDHGCINLGGLLKVTASYSTSANLAVYVGEKMIFKKTFDIVARKLRVATLIPESCLVGCKLENVVFEIVDPSGTVDEDIHGKFHTLSIAYRQSTVDDALQYTFHRGKSIVPIVLAPNEEGTFEFVAYHTHHPELQTTISIRAVSAPKLEPLEWHGQEPESSMPDVFHATNLSLTEPVSCTPTKMDAFILAIIDDVKTLDKEICNVAELIKSLDMNIKKLSDQRLSIMEEIQKLQAELEPQALSQMENLVQTKQQILTYIEQGGSVASIICRLFKMTVVKEPVKHFTQDVIGPVALLGTVDNVHLSSMLSTFLGEEFMLAIVCKSYYGVKLLEIYNENGEVDRSCILSKEAAALGIEVPRQFNVICLEGIRPYVGEINHAQSQRLLNLPDPRLPSGITPPGFVGYAVNLIDIDICHLNIRTRAEFGLRETLYYRLFGELQIYKTRNDMQKAILCIRNGAISLDGSIIRGNGITSLGRWGDPKVQFPVRAIKGRSQFSPHTISMLQVLKEKQNELAETDAKISEEEKALLKARNKFTKKVEKLNTYIESKKHLCNISGYSNH